jgi:hypothetical protein
MNKKTIIFICVIFIIILFWGFKGFFNKEAKSSSASNQTPSVTPEPQDRNKPLSVSQEVLPADKIEVVHFHGTHQCWSCITVGEYALKTIKEKFPDEYASGRLVFKDINGELKENQAVVIKYQARGSSLFVNAIRGDKDDIKEDVTVWRLVNSQEQFADYFEDKLKTLLGK